ncbi:permease prefix domain 1-containing protein [Microbacterium sp. LRZ72]|uniref:permease prefix domain 1-containing protein n=1 Tax=Microbacterium sp. LRZ72 TaxID=2942481 RepID=UPI0029B3FCAE|nr:permease prefix domain 1-containing protein [Microbacterium sp. LRZ72]MDX2376014.1 permease prefix domain 1-containing protein [Microbacterium sp. LRZ72]
MSDRGTASLTDRYVAAAVRGVPEKARADLAAELRASIADQVDARTAAGEPADAAERAVITGFGDPDVLAAGYADRPLQLIGPRFYLTWRRLLTLLLWIVVPIIGFIVAAVEIVEGEAVGAVITAVWVAVLGVGVQLCFWVTVVFAVLERTGAGKAMPIESWSPDRLPEPRQQGAGLPELIGSLVFLCAVAGAVVWDRLFGLVYVGDGWRAALSPQLWPWWVAGLFVILVAEAVFAVVLYRMRRWTYGLAAVNAVLALAFAIPAIVLTAGGMVIDPALYAYAGDAAAQVQVVIPTAIAIGIAAIALWDIADGFFKARTAR